MYQLVYDMGDFSLFMPAVGTYKRSRETVFRLTSSNYETGTTGTLENEPAMR
jgi:hypothetical protein